jgi:hypothetical protein
MMIIVTLDGVEQQDYLLSLLDQHTRQGIALLDIPRIHNLLVAISNGQRFDPASMGKPTLEEAGPNGVVVNIPVTAEAAFQP